MPGSDSNSERRSSVMVVVDDVFIAAFAIDTGCRCIFVYFGADATEANFWPPAVTARTVPLGAIRDVMSQ